MQRRVQKIQIYNVTNILSSVTGGGERDEGKRRKPGEDKGGDKKMHFF